MIPDRVLRRLISSDAAVALLGDLLRAIAGTLVVLIIAAWITYYSILVPTVFTRLHMNDFGKFYYAAQLYLDGQPMYGPSPATAIPVGPNESRQFWNLNPPHFHLIILPLAKLAPKPAFGLWAGLNLAALGLSLLLIGRELALRWTVSRVIWAAFAAVVWSATDATIVTAQLTFLLTLGVTVAWRAARQGRWTGAGILLGVLASVKPFLGVFLLYFLATRRLKPAAAMAAAALTCFAIGLVFFGWASHVDWLRILGTVTWSWAPMNASLAGLVSRTLDSNPIFVTLYPAASLAPIVSWFGAGMIALLTFREVMRSSTHSPDRTFLLLLLMALLVTPIGWVYYAWIVVGPLLAWWPTRERSSITGGLFLLAMPGFICPVLLTRAWSGHAWAAPTIGSVYFWMILAVWCAVIRRPPVGDS